MEGGAALLSWLEEALTSRRFTPGAVREALRDRLWLLDDEGIRRPVPALAKRDARIFFGARRGDFAASATLPRLASALGIPARPDAPMIAAFLVEIGDGLDRLDAGERHTLMTRLPDCLARFGQHATAERLPKGAAIVVLRRGELALARIGDPEVHMFEPSALADALEVGAMAALSEPVPTVREAGLYRRLLASGVPDLWPLVQVREVLPGPHLEALDVEAETLRTELLGVLGDVVGRRAQVHETLSIQVTLATIESPPVTFAVDAWLDGHTLRLTPDALRDPTLLAPALVRAPAPRAALLSWLGDEQRDARAKPRIAGAEAKTGAADGESPGVFARLFRWFGGDGTDSAAREKVTAAPRKKKERATPERERGAEFFRTQSELDEQLERGEGWVESRRETPDFGFVFTPPAIVAPWLYAPSFVAARFDRRGQRWEPTRFARPEPSGEAGIVVMRGRLPAGEVVLPVPLYARVTEIRGVRAGVEARSTPYGATMLRLDEATNVQLRLTLGRAPDLTRTRPLRGASDALVSFVPDDELPEETRAAVLNLDADESASTRAFALRDFVRERYRYDPSYLEDDGVGRWLARVTQGRANVHVAALHAAGDSRHLGAGVCYELNVLLCELLRRAGIHALIATGWVFDGGALSSPDHLWAVALLEDETGAPVWLPVDASATRDGRPLRVPRAAPVRLRAPKDPRAKAPTPPRWGPPTAGDERAPNDRAARKRKRLPPRLELIKVLHHLGELAGRSLDDEERREIERALTDPVAASALLDRLRGDED